MSTILGIESSSAEYKNQSTVQSSSAILYPGLVAAAFFIFAKTPLNIFAAIKAVFLKAIKGRVHWESEGKSEKGKEIRNKPTAVHLLMHSTRDRVYQVTVRIQYDQ